MATTLTPDGSGNDTAQIAAALIDGADVILDGAEFFSDPITISKSTYGTAMNMTLRGSSDDVKLTPRNNDVPFLTFNRGVGLNLRNLRILYSADSFTWPNTTDLVNAIRIFGMQDVYMERIYTEKSFDAIFISGSSVAPTSLDLSVIAENGSEPSTNIGWAHVQTDDAYNDGWYFGWLNKAQGFAGGADDCGGNGVESNAQDIVWERPSINRCAVNGWSTKSSTIRTILRNPTTIGNTAAGIASDNTGNHMRNFIIENPISRANGQSGIALDRTSASFVHDDVLIINPQLIGNSQVTGQTWGNLRIGLLATANIQNRIRVVGGLLDGLGPQQLVSNILAYHADDVQTYGLSNINKSGADVIDASVTNYQAFT